jgi:uncharacterized Rmd1/YagE family protein
LKEFIFVLYFKISTMKKKISSIVFVAAIAVAATWNFSQNQKEAALSDVVLENVEALASGESDWRYASVRHGLDGTGLYAVCVGTGLLYCI